ncbi:MAG TPA: PilZ domain-containing protein, partial [Nitrospirae bacterium]|nr:PilZ domain-containing protein [Nitrospirota bacterium]
MIHDKRRHKRFEVFVVVEIKSLKTPANYYLGITRDFSFEGFSFESQSMNLEVGENVEFKFKHPQDSSYVFDTGIIVWKQKDNKFDCFMGVKFKEVDKAAKSKMLEILSFAGNIPVDSFLSDKGDKDIHVEETEATNHEFFVDEPETTRRVEEVEAAHDEIFELDMEEVNDTGLQMDSGQATYDDTSHIKKDQRKKIWLYIPIAIAIVITLFVIFENYNMIFKSPIPVSTKSASHENIYNKHSIPIVIDAQTRNVEYYIQVGAWKHPD